MTKRPTEKAPKNGESYWCKPCREASMIHCAEVDVCGSMKIVKDTAIRALLKSSRRKGK